MLPTRTDGLVTVTSTEDAARMTPALEVPPLGAGEKIAAIAASTMIETASGWKEAGKIRIGDEVYALDGGLVPVACATTRTLPSHSTQLWHIPEGVFDNCDGLRVCAGQHIMITNTSCEQLYEFSDVLVPVTALAGYRGIRPCSVQSETQVVELSFIKEEIIYAQSGSLLMCPASDGTTDGFFRALSYGEARALLTHMNGAHVSPGLPISIISAAA